MAFIRLPAAALAAPLAALGLALGAAALAPAPAAAQSQGSAAQAQSFTDTQIESFAVAALAVRDIRSRYMSQMQAAASDEEREQLAQQATAEMVDAVEASPGISVDEYNTIVQAAAEDEALANRINQQIQGAAQ